jgi:hypothetical protein
MIPIRHASHDRLRRWRFRDRVARFRFRRTTAAPIGFTSMSTDQAALSKIRRSPAAANEILRAFVPERYLTGVLMAFAHSVQVAHRTSPSKWGLRLNRNSPGVSAFVPPISSAKGAPFETLLPVIAAVFER